MHYLAFLILWLPQPDPTYTPKAAFIQHFDTFKECEEFRSRISNPDHRKDAACILLVVDPKSGIAE